jgi:large subunit ribosomal protein L5
MDIKNHYKNVVTPALREKLGIANPMLVPRLEKIVINMAFGIVEKDVQKSLLENFAAFAGQQPILCKARKSVSNFKLREGMVIGAKVTLRGPRMLDFFDRFVNNTLPRIRDFRGVPTRGFDGRGNYTMGIKEQTIFPEVDPAKVKAEKGMDITFVTTAGDTPRARLFLEEMGMPFAGRK